MNQSTKHSGDNAATTPGRPHDTSRQQKHDDQNLDSGSGSLDQRSSGDGRSKKAPTPPGAK